MAETVRHPEGSDRIDRGVLDSVMAGAGRRQVRGMSGQRTTFQECAREKDRRGKLPRVAVAALGWFAAGFLPAGASHLRGADAVAVSRRIDSVCGGTYPAHAESAGANECQAGPCDLRRNGRLR